tara:strand:- start:8382 stop:8672 length:291 start_codon:yes stop_codon:yes gene_type:complete
MEVVYLRSFLNDIKKLRDDKVKKKIKAFIFEIKEAKSQDQIQNIKKLKGYQFAYRSKIGDCRLGIYKETNHIEFARFVKRNDIYKLFHPKGIKKQF